MSQGPLISRKTDHISHIIIKAEMKYEFMSQINEHTMEVICRLTHIHSSDVSSDPNLFFFFLNISIIKQMQANQVQHKVLHLISSLARGLFVL